MERSGAHDAFYDAHIGVAPDDERIRETMKILRVRPVPGQKTKLERSDPTLADRFAAELRRADSSVSVLCVMSRFRADYVAIVEVLGRTHFLSDPTTLSDALEILGVKRVLMGRFPIAVRGMPIIDLEGSSRRSRDILDLLANTDSKECTVRIVDRFGSTGPLKLGLHYSSAQTSET